MFEQNIEKDKNGCWNWTGRMHLGNLPSFSPPKSRRHRMVRRVMWEQYKGPIPSRAAILPGCKNKHCVNPDHLVTGKRGKPQLSLTKKFWTKVDKRGPDDCWNWLAYIRKSEGCGIIIHDGKYLRAYRVAWELCRGQTPPKNQKVRHKCKNKLCCNPKHLFTTKEIV